MVPAMRAAVACAVLAAVVAPAQAGDAACKRQISVVGRAAETRAPDFAEVMVGIEARGATPAAALDAASKAVAGVSGQARALGVPPADIGTAAVSLQAASRPVTHPGGATTEEPDGYRAGNMVTIRLADMDRLGDLLRQALESGANRIDGVSFGLRDSDKTEAALQVAAARDARTRAASLAEAVGAKLGPLCTLGTAAAAPPMMARALAAPMAAKGRRVPIEAGTIPLSAEVSATFAAEP